MEQENKGNQSDNIWDRIFKIILQKMPQMVLPLINEVFHEGYGMDAEIVPLNNEFYNEDGSKVVSDTSFMVDKMLYHFECQFSNDKEMAFRMFEYDTLSRIRDNVSYAEKRVIPKNFNSKQSILYFQMNYKEISA